jgi:hypothetical protein
VSLSGTAASHPGCGAASEVFVRLSPFCALYAYSAIGESFPFASGGPLMLKKFPFIRAVALSLFLAATPVAADTLPLTPNLIDLASKQGEELLLDAEARAAFLPLTAQFVTQKNQAYCGVASLVMVMNALRVPAPSTPEFEPYKTFTQDNFLNDQTEKILPREVLAKQGMTLDQIGAIARTYPVTVEVHHAGDSNIEEFRSLALDYLGRKDHYVVINYLRRAIGQETGGHISPLAAYDADTDRFLVLDVSRYKYPPVWVSTADLFAAMNTQDSVNENRTRGFVLLRPEA